MKALVLAALIACGRGPGPCKPQAASDSAGQPSRTCEVRR